MTSEAFPTVFIVDDDRGMRPLDCAPNPLQAARSFFARNTTAARAV